MKITILSAFILTAFLSITLFFFLTPEQLQFKNKDESCLIDYIDPILDSNRVGLKDYKQFTSDSFIAEELVLVSEHKYTIRQSGCNEYQLILEYDISEYELPNTNDMTIDLLEKLTRMMAEGVWPTEASFDNIFQAITAMKDKHYSINDDFEFNGSIWRVYIPKNSETKSIQLSYTLPLNKG